MSRSPETAKTEVLLRSPYGTPIIGIAGWKKSGKTTLTERLVAHFTGQGLRIATVKHAHHAFQIDDDATDSARHRHAGAAQIAIVSARRYALVTELKSSPEPDFADVIAMLAPADLIIVEGYKSAPILKIEARRSAQLEKRALAADDPLVIAIAADYAVPNESIPILPLDDVAGIAAFVAERVGLARRETST